MVTKYTFVEIDMRNDFADDPRAAALGCGSAVPEMPGLHRILRAHGDSFRAAQRPRVQRAPCARNTKPSRRTLQRAGVERGRCGSSTRHRADRAASGRGRAVSGARSSSSHLGVRGAMRGIGWSTSQFDSGGNPSLSQVLKRQNC
jgi:hypothetical protein